MSNITLFAIAAFIGGMGAACTADAAEVQSLVAEGADGAAVVIHNEQGPCRGDAKRAEFITAKSDRIPGCWKIIGPGVIQVVFFDGDGMQLQTAWFKPVKVM